jgi:acyl-coenzyme A thioesterase PaaI-like protein
MTSVPSASLEQLRQLVLAMPMARTLGLRFTRVERGHIELEIPVAAAFTFRPGQLQATPVFAAADFAAVSAAGSVLPPGWANATIDATIKLVGPAPRLHPAGARPRHQRRPAAHRLRRRRIRGERKWRGKPVRDAAWHGAKHRTDAQHVTP